MASIRDETPRVKTLELDAEGWSGHRAGQHLDVRLTAEDGYQAERSYSIASAPEDPTLALTVERLDDGEVSPYLTTILEAGDQLELRGPIGGYFVWEAGDARPVLLVGGWTVAAGLQPGSFNAVAGTISSLAAEGAADRWVMTLALAGVGACHAVTGLAL